MPTINKILFPVDFSRQCVGAARYVEAFAGRFDAELMLLHVVTPGTNTLAEELEGKRKAHLESFLEEELKYLKTERVCVIADPAEEIVATAAAWGADLVMMPTHGLGFYRRLLLGSVTAKVLHDLELPVWTDAHAENAPPLEKITIRKILCAIDLDLNSPCVLAWGAGLAQEYGASLAIAHAIPAPEPSAAVRYLDEEFRAALAVEARKRIDALQSAAGSNAAVLIEAGEPARAVSKIAEQYGADLLIIGRHGKAGLAGHLRQNSYGMIRESPCPVLSI